MNSVFRQYINKFNDILIFSTSLSEHILNIEKKNIPSLKNAGLELEISAVSWKKKTEFLGHILTPKGVNPEERKFIKDYSKNAYPMIKGHPISFASRTLNDNEKLYSTGEKELEG